MICRSINILFICGVILFGQTVHAQNCGPSTSRKAQKLLENALNNSKLDLRDRVDVFRKSLEEDPECIECLFGKARAEYGLAVEQNTGYDRAYSD
ncbi:MAG: hypothetical protein WBG42_01355, partial [Cryomorphaceae bacterium]